MNVVTFIRRVLGEKTVKKLSHIMAVYSRRIISPPSRYRPFGVSALVWSRNEREWIRASMLSVAEIVDEYVVIDSSDDDTPDIAVETASELGKKIRIIKIPPTFRMDIIGNLALRYSTYRWLLKWDPDFILHEKFVPLLKWLIRKLDEIGLYFAVKWSHICLEIDLEHYDPRNYLHKEAWLFTYSPKLRYFMDGWMERLYIPPWYARIEVPRPISFHMRTVKDPVRLLLRKYWYKMRSEGVKEDLLSYTLRNIRSDYGTDDVKEAARIFVEERRKKLKTFDYRILPPSIWFLEMNRRGRIYKPYKTEH